MIENTDPSLFSASLRMFWGLLIVSGILLIIYGLLRKRLSFIQTNSNSEIQIKEMRHIMQKKSLCLVEVKGQTFLLGVGTENFTLLATFPENNQAATFQESLTNAEQNEK